MTKPAKGKVAQNFTDADLLEQLNGKKGTTLWLGRYTKDDVLHLLEKFGILPAIRKKGFAGLVIVIESLEPFVQALRIFNEKAGADNQLAEFRLREVAFLPQHFAVDAPLTMLKIEWLMLQNPQATFSPERPRLPGQRHPGLGLGKQTVQFLVYLAEAHHLAGVLNFPEFFHNAYLYLEYFHYCDPRLKGIVLALRRDLIELSLAELSWAIYLGCVNDANTGQTYEWQADALVLPLAEKLKKYFSSAEYEQIVYRALAEARFVLNREKFEKVLLDS
ncbi:hypothetical protein L0337_20965 [candidate division KSB1 bacterium]|nr:hypothetical protein [candidate division KSB1 bacterium]